MSSTSIRLAKRLTITAGCPPRLSIRRRGGKLRLSAGDIAVEGHIGAPCSMVSALVVGTSCRALGRPTIWKSPANLWYPEAEAFIALASACLGRGRVNDARDLAYLAIVETFYFEDVEEGTKPPPPGDVAELVAKMDPPTGDESGAHLSVIRRLVARLAKADRTWQMPLLRALDEVVGDAGYASPLTLAEHASGPALAMARHADARGEAARSRLIETLAGSLVLGHAYAEALPLLDLGQVRRDDCGHRETNGRGEPLLDHILRELYAARVRFFGAALRTVLAVSRTARSAALTDSESGKASARSGARMANAGPSSAASACIASSRRPAAEMRFAYGFVRQLLAFEAPALFRVERARGDDADRRFIMNLDVDDQELSPEQRIPHDLHPSLIV